MSSARETIFQALRATSTPATRDIPPQVDRQEWGQSEKVERLTQQMSAVHAEVHHLADGDWIGWVNRELPQRGLSRLLAGGEVAQQLKQRCASSIELKHYQQPIEQWKSTLFNEVDVGITSTRGAIAHSGSLALWATIEEPRLLSLVPPVHIALLHANQIHENFEQMVVNEQWQQQMPTNTLLISGPSKTADIQQVLAYGGHGPKELIVLILEDA